MVIFLGVAIQAIYEFFLDPLNFLILPFSPRELLIQLKQLERGECYVLQEIILNLSLLFQLFVFILVLIAIPYGLMVLMVL